MCYFKNTPLTGRKIEFDYSKIRKKGAPLKTGGGKAPGHEGLKKAHQNIKRLLDYIIEEKNQSRIKPINVYDILMHCADAVLSGGIRRAATMAIFDYDDEEMMNSKVNFHVTKYGGFEKEGNFYQGWVYTDGKFGGFKGHKYEVTLTQFEYDQLREKKEISWIHIEPQRARSNNSVLLLRDSCTLEQFSNIIEKTKQWGEPGFIFANDPWALFNPCAEIGFVPKTKDGRFGFHFCNLTTQNGSMISSLEEFLECTEAATLIGTLQAGYTDFFYLNSASKELAEEEALLGVSITGMMDNPEILLNPRNQYVAAQLAVKVNKEWSKIIGINSAARITTLKPEGTSSLILKCASGIHPHHSYQYFRRIQMNKLDPVYKFFKKFNPHACEESVWSANKTDDIVTFPISVPSNVIVKDNLKAIEHLNIIKDTYENWIKPGTTDRNERNVTHNVSCTIVVKDNEWDEVSKYIYSHRESFAAVSFLSYFGDKMYKQAPLEKKLPEDEERWNNLISNWKSVDYSQLIEKEDKTELQQTIACAGNSCELL
jgi:ribonucleoside-diphosphate reductase alpha chain